MWYWGKVSLYNFGSEVRKSGTVAWVRWTNPPITVTRPAQSSIKDCGSETTRASSQMVSISSIATESTSSESSKGWRAQMIHRNALLTRSRDNGWSRWIFCSIRMKMPSSPWGRSFRAFRMSCSVRCWQILSSCRTTQRYLHSNKSAISSHQTDTGSLTSHPIPI